MTVLPRVVDTSVREDARAMRVRHQTELVKNCLIPMSDGVTLGADLYRPLTDHPVPALLSFYPYHKDDGIGPGYFEGPLRSLAQAGYACLLVDIRGTGNSGGYTVAPLEKRERRDLYEAVEWAAQQEWCDGKVGVWGLSYGSMAALLAAADSPPHLGAVAAFHGAGDLWDHWLLIGGRLGMLQVVANWSAWMTGWNFMPPGYRDAEGRWRKVWREHLESNVPYLVTTLDRLASGEVQLEAYSETLKGIRTPVYLWAGWHDIFPKAMAEAYGAIQAPKKLTAGPWLHVMPDVGHAGRVDYLYELQRWFDYWLRGEDTGIMDEPPVAVWVQEEETWAYEDDFPPPDVEKQVYYLAPQGALSHTAPTVEGSDSVQYDATVGVCADLWDPMGWGIGLPLDQRFDEAKGLVYTTAPLEADMEICGAPEAVIGLASTLRDPLLVVKLCDLAPDGRSSLITTGWVDPKWAQSHATDWGRVLEDGSRLHLSLIPTCYVVRAGHRLRVFVAGADFPRLLPSCGPGELSVAWGGESQSLVEVPVRPPRERAGRPSFHIPQEAPHVAVRPAIWRMERRPIEGTMTVHTGDTISLGIDGGEGPATVWGTHRCSATASESGHCQPSVYAKSETCWENEKEKIELRTVVAYRPTGLDVGVDVLLNGTSYWHKGWSRDWPEQM